MLRQLLAQAMLYKEYSHHTHIIDRWAQALYHEGSQ